MAQYTQEQLTQQNNDNITSNGRKQISGLKLRTLLQNVIDTAFGINLWKSPAPNLEPNTNGFPKSWAMRLSYLAGGEKYTALVVDSNGVIKKQLSKDIIISKGAVASSADFPTPEEVEYGWKYDISQPVTDNDPEKTNTGQSFGAGQKIYWGTDKWEDAESVYTGQTETEESLIGCTIEKNGIKKSFGGIKNNIDELEKLSVPENFEYNVFSELNIDGEIEINGDINIIY